jgi:hypothetical protein
LEIELETAGLLVTEFEVLDKYPDERRCSNRLNRYGPTNTTLQLH